MSYNKLALINLERLSDKFIKGNLLFGSVD